jgi:hypothetical protein
MFDICDPLIFMVGRIGFEPMSNGLKDVSKRIGVSGTC